MLRSQIEALVEQMYRRSGFKARRLFLYLAQPFIIVSIAVADKCPKMVKPPDKSDPLIQEGANTDSDSLVVTAAQGGDLVLRRSNVKCRLIWCLYLAIFTLQS